MSQPQASANRIPPPADKATVLTDPERKKRMSTTGSLRKFQVFGLVVLLLLTGGMGGWAAYASIAGAVVASAQVVVESNSKKVQHLEGGIVSHINVRNGDLVKAGDVILRLDDTETRAGLGIINAQLNELLARLARLEAERDLADGLIFSEDLLEQKSDPKIARIMSGQEKLFSSRREAKASKKSQLSQRVEQLEEEIRGLEAQRVSKEEQARLIKLELADLNKLLEKKLVPVSRVLALQREAARLEGERGQLIADAARAKGRIGETKLAILQVDQDARTEVLTELRQGQAKVSELLERRLAARSRLKRVELTAPRGGYVHDLQVHTVGGVISAGEQVMMIVPEKDSLLVRAKVNPQDIDNIKIGQETVVRFPSFNARVTPELRATVEGVSADLTSENPQEPPYYAVRVRLNEGEIAKLGDQRLKPGMPAEAFIQTPERTVLSYLLRPFTDQIMRAFSEG
ncbi:MAG: HlyD family type I secretion periplasmic adaptor subunit [Rhizobiales bacterium]|nr:HlyD family type I secretion periplasmic adaptor subunit [Hyphomicrobiales bacterium]